MKPIALKAEYRAGAGWHIKALIPTPINCVEATLKATYQPIAQLHDNCMETCIGYEPWIQFPPEEWNKMIEEVFTELVELWNKKHNGKIKKQSPMQKYSLGDRDDCGM